MIEVIGYWIGYLIGIAIGVFILTFIVQLTTDFVASFKPPYKMAYKATFLFYVASLIFFSIGQLTTSASEAQIPGISQALLMATGFIVGALLFGILLKHPDKGAIGFGKGLLISVIQLLVVAVGITIIGVAIVII